MRNHISRREFVSLAAAVPFLQIRAPLTAQQIVDQIKSRIGTDWKADGVDTFKAGDPTTPVKGIATSAMATMDVLKESIKAGANLIITSEPTFYSRADTARTDVISTAKKDFILKNQLVVWRFSEHWRQRMPDPVTAGLAEALGWGKLRATDDPRRVAIPNTSMDALVSDVKKKLNSRGGIRVVGDPKLNVTKVGLLPGTTAIQAAIGLFPLVDVIIAGEVREWETVEFARDKVSASERKSLVLLGRVVSENPGMNECAKWLKEVVPQVRTTWIPVEDPYWRPA